jgi:thiamine kinase-like enzyme
LQSFSPAVTLVGVGELDDILAVLEPSLGQAAGEPVPLEGGITNRNFLAELGGRQYVIRRHGKDTGLLGIDRTAERMASEEAAALGIAPAVAASFRDGLVTRFIACMPVAASELALSAGELGVALRRFHDSGLKLPVAFWIPELLGRYARLVGERGVELPGGYAETVAVAQRIGRALPLERAVPCHNDLLPGNIIRASEDGRLLIVDWEYAGMGHRYFDLGNLSVNNGFDESAEDRLLGAYHGEPPTDSRRAALKLMRVLSDAREAAWAVVQGGISDLDFDFARYGEKHFERLLSSAREPDFEEWLATA